VARDRLPELAFVEHRGAAGGDLLERLRELLHHEPRADGEACDRGLAQDDREQLVQECLSLDHLDAAARELDGGRDHFAPREPPVRPVRLFEAREAARDGAGARTDPEVLTLVARERHRDLLGRWALATRDRDEEVEQPRRARGVDEHEAATTRPRERALGDPRGESRCDTRVDCVAAAAERLRPDLGCDWVTGGDRAFHGREPLLVQLDAAS
jgi:hypothetical protein